MSDRDLVAADKLRARYREVAKFSRNVLWLDGAAHHLQRVETRCQFHEFLVVAQAARPAAAFAVERIGAAAARREDQTAVLNKKVLLP